MPLPIELKITDILKIAKAVEAAGADPKKLVLVIPPENPKVKFYVIEKRPVYVKEVRHAKR